MTNRFNIVQKESSAVSVNNDALGDISHKMQIWILHTSTIPSPNFEIDIIQPLILKKKVSDE